MSPEWNDFYRSWRMPHPTSTYAQYEKLISMFVSSADRMLELGSGTASEIPFFVNRGFGYHGIDGSVEAVAGAVRRYPNLVGRIICGDFTQSLHFGGEFDLICERAAITHNRLVDIRRCLNLVFDALKPGGIFISSDWFSDLHSEQERGDVVEPGTRCGYPDGQFAGVGEVHFSSTEELIELFGAFEGIHLQERIVHRPSPNALVPAVMYLPSISTEFSQTGYISAVWDIVVRKPK